MAIFKRNTAAWQFFESITPYARKQSIQWVLSAKKEETRQRRLEQLIACSNKQEKIPQLEWKKKSKSIGWTNSILMLLFYPGHLVLFFVHWQ